MKFLKWLTIIGTLLALGFLSFAGTLLLNPSWFGVSPLMWGCMAFGFAVLIEVLVIVQNINQAWAKWSNFGENHLKNALRVAILDELPDEPSQLNTPSLLSEYRQQKKRLEEIDHEEDELAPIDWILKFSTRWKLHKEEQALKISVKALEEELIEKYQLGDLPASAIADLKPENKIARASLTQELQKRSSRGWVVLIKIAAVLTGLCALFAALAASQLGLTQNYISIAAGTPLSWAICWPIAIFAGLGNGLLIYNNLMQLMHNRTLSDFTTSKSKNWFYYVIRFIILILALVVVVTLFYTWWTSGTDVAAQALPFLGTGTTFFIGILAAAMIIPVLLWNLTNAFNSAELVENAWKKGKFGKRWQQFREEISAAWEQAAEKRNYHHFINPFRLLEYLVNIFFRGGVLAVHSMSIGLTADRLGSLSPAIPVAVSGILEAGTDLGYLYHDHDEEVSPDLSSSSYGRLLEANSPPTMSATADKAQDSYLPAYAKENGPDMAPVSPYQRLPNENDVSGSPHFQIKKLPEPEHTHADLAGILLIFILLPLKIARFAFDFIFSSLLCCFLKEGWQESIRTSWNNIFSNPSLNSEPLGNRIAAVVPASKWEVSPTPAITILTGDRKGGNSNSGTFKSGSNTGELWNLRGDQTVSSP